MKSASLAELKNELKSLPQNRLLDICLRMAKHKKDNKELLTYLIFESEDEQAYLKAIRADMDELFEEVNESSAYLAKKTIRKILKQVHRQIQYSGKTETEIEALIYFCQKVKKSKFYRFFNSNDVLANMYKRQLARIDKCIAGLHEDLQFDYLQLRKQLHLT